MRLVARPIEEWPGSLTPEGSRHDSQFTASWSDTVNLLEKEVGMLAGHSVAVVVQLAVTESDCRLDGWIKANARAAHPGAILAFESKHGPLRYSTDLYRHGSTYGGRYLVGWQANVRAIALGLEALRKVDRYGIARGGEQYRGWRAIPQTTGGTSNPLGFLAVVADTPLAECDDPKVLYKRALIKAHPDHGGTPSRLAEVMDAGRKLGVGMTPEETRSTHALASPPEPSESRRARIRATIRLAAQMVERGDPNTQLVSKVRVTRLNKKGKPVGEPVTAGPLLFTCTFPLTDIDPELIRTLTGEA